MSERGKLNVDIGGNASGFRQALNAAKTEVKHFANETRQSWSLPGITGNVAGGFLGGFSFEAIKSSFESFLGRASQLRELSEQLEMSADATQKWQQAADRLGLSFGAIQNVLTSIQQKRFEARNSKEARDLFKQLGISDQDVLDTEGIGASDFALKVMRAAQGSAYNRGIFGQIAGRRGVKALGAASLFGSMTAPISGEAMEEAHKAERMSRTFGDATSALWSKVLDKMSPLFGIPSRGDQAFWNKVASGAPITHGHGTSDPIAQAVKQAIADPLVGIRQQENEQRARELHDAQLRTHAAERGNMDVINRRKSIRSDMADASKELGTLLMQSVLRMMTPQEMLRIEELKQRSAGFLGELRERPDFISTSAGARVGLFSGSDMSSADLNRQAVSLLQKIERNTNGKDWNF